MTVKIYYLPKLIKLLLRYQPASTCVLPPHPHVSHSPACAQTQRVHAVLDHVHWSQCARHLHVSMLYLHHRVCAWCLFVIDHVHRWGTDRVNAHVIFMFICYTYTNLPAQIIMKIVLTESAVSNCAMTVLAEARNTISEKEYQVLNNSELYKN